MLHDFSRNTLLVRNIEKSSKTIENICYVFDEKKEIAIIERARGYIRRPVIMTFSELQHKIRRGTYQYHEEFDSNLAVIDDDNFSKRDLAIRDQRYKQIEPIVGNKAVLEHYLYGSNQMYLLEEIASKHKVSLKHIYNMIHRYLAYGGVENALLPHFNACGRASRLPPSEKHPGTKRGRPAIYSKLNTRNWTEADSIFFKNEFWPKVEQPSHKIDRDLYDEFCLKRFGHPDTRKNQIVSFEQFLYHFPNCIPLNERIRREGGSTNFDNNAKAVTGSARHGVRGPGDLYQMDATTASVNLLYSKNDKERIPCGRPTLYVVIDVYTSMIVGFYVSLSDPKWDLATEALYNAFMPKDEFLKEFPCRGIKAKDWPCFGVPKRLGMDRDPAHSSNNLSALLQGKFGIEEAEMYPAYRGSAKGINERAIGRIEARNKRLRGARNKNTAIDKPHPSNDALYTYRDYVKAVIREVVAHNNYSFKKRLLNEYTVKHASDASPLEIWNLAYENFMGRRKQPSEDKIRFSLLKEENAVVTAEGILVRDRLYENPALRGLFANARTLGRDRIKVRESSTTTNYIWYRDPNDPEQKIYRCRLSEKSSAYADACTWEAGMLHESFKHMKEESKKNRQNAQQRDQVIQTAEEKVMKDRRRKLTKTLSSGVHKDSKKAREAEKNDEQSRSEEKLSTFGQYDIGPQNSNNKSAADPSNAFDVGTRLMHQHLKNKESKQ